MITILLSVGLTLLIVFFLGFGLTLFFIPEKLKPYALWLTPWFTIFFLVFFLTINSLLGFSVKQSSPLAIILMVGFNGWIVWKTKKHYTFNLKEDGLILLVVITSIIFNLSPLLRREKIATTVSLGNNDAIVYAVSPDYLQNHDIVTNLLEKPEPLKPGLAAANNLIQASYRWGPPMVMAFFLNIFKLQGYQYFYLFQTIIFGLTLPLVYILMKILYKPTTLGLILLLVMTSLNTNLLYMIYHDFFGQVFFWPLSLFLLILFYSFFLSSEENSHQLTNHHYLIAFVLTVLYLSYHEGVIFIIGPLFILFLFRWVMGQNIVGYWSSLVKIALVTCLTTPFIIINGIVLEAIQISPRKEPIGWQPFRSQVPYANPFEMMGFHSIHSFPPLPFGWALALSVIAVFVIGAGFLKSKKKLVGGSFILVFLLFFIWTGLLEKNFFIYNRVVTYTLPLFLVFFATGIVYLLDRHKLILAVVVTLLISLETYAGMPLNKRFINERAAVDRSLISLQELNDNKQINEVIYTEQVFTGLVSLWRQIWTDYFLYPNKLVYSPLNFRETTSSIPDGSLVLLSKQAVFYDPPKITLSETVWENEYYILGRLCQTDQCMLNFKKVK